MNMDLDKIKGLVELDKAADRSEEEARAMTEQAMLASCARKLSKWNKRCKTWLETIDYLYTHGYKKELENYQLDELRVNGLINNCNGYGDLIVSYYKGHERLLTIDHKPVYYDGKKWWKEVLFGDVRVKYPLQIEDYKSLLEAERLRGYDNPCLDNRYSKSRLERYEMAYNGFMKEFEDRVSMRSAKAGKVSK